MFLKFWIIWAFAGLSLATALFWWAMKSRQFEDSRRAAYLPLKDLDDEPEVRKRPGAELSLYVLLGVVALGLGGTIFMVVLAHVI